MGVGYNDGTCDYLLARNCEMFDGFMKPYGISQVTLDAFKREHQSFINNLFSCRAKGPDDEGSILQTCERGQLTLLRFKDKNCTDFDRQLCYYDMGELTVFKGNSDKYIRCDA